MENTWVPEEDKCVICGEYVFSGDMVCKVCSKGPENQAEELLKSSKEVLQYCILCGCRPAERVVQAQIGAIDAFIQGRER